MPTLQPVSYLPAPVLVVNVIPNYRTTKDLGLQSTDCSLQHPAKSLVILEGPFNPNYRKGVAFLSLWFPLQMGGTEMPLQLSSLKQFGEGFPGGSVVKNPLADAGDKGLIPGSRKIPRAAEQLSLCHNY